MEIFSPQQKSYVFTLAEKKLFSPAAEKHTAGMHTDSLVTFLYKPGIFELLLNIFSCEKNEHFEGGSDVVALSGQVKLAS